MKMYYDDMHPIALDITDSLERQMKLYDKVLSSEELDTFFKFITEIIEPHTEHDYRNYN